MGVYEEDFNTSEEIKEYYNILSTVEYDAENNGGLIYRFENKYYIVINFLDGGYLIAPIEDFTP